MSDSGNSFGRKPSPATGESCQRVKHPPTVNNVMAEPLERQLHSMSKNTRAFLSPYISKENGSLQKVRNVLYNTSLRAYTVRSAGETRPPADRSGPYQRMLKAPQAYQFPATHGNMRRWRRRREIEQSRLKLIGRDRIAKQIGNGFENHG